MWEFSPPTETGLQHARASPVRRKRCHGCSTSPSISGRPSQCAWGPRRPANPSHASSGAGRSMDCDSTTVFSDVGLEEEIVLLEDELNALENERSRAVSIVETNAKRSKRYVEMVQELREKSYKAMRDKDQATAKKLLQEKATVTIALTKAESRVEAKSMLALKLDRIIGARERKLLQLYSSTNATERQGSSPRSSDVAFTPDNSWTASEDPPSARDHVFSPDQDSVEACRKPRPTAPVMGAPGSEGELTGDESMERCLPIRSFSSEDDLTDVILGLERNTLERMLEISTVDDEGSNPSKGKLR